MSSNISRRSFLKGSALMALGLSMGAAGASAETEEQKSGIVWTDAADLIIVGGGGTGFTAAIEAARAGSSCLILEKCAYCGGDTLRSGGMIMVGGSELQKSEGYTDSQENFAKTELRYTGDFADREMVEEMCMHSLEAMKFMQDMGREYTVLQQMNPVWGYDIAEEWAPRTHSSGKETRTGHFATLEQEAAKYDAIRVKTSVEVAHLIQDETGAVIGVKDTNGVCYRANKGVLLATASFGHNTEMSKRYNPMNYWALRYEEIHGALSPNGQHTLNTGDGIRMAQEIGADLALTSSNCIADCCALSFDALYGALLVNPRGKRFVQENAHWGYLNQMVFNEAVKINATNPETVQFWIIADENAATKDLYFNLLNQGMALTGTEAYISMIQKADTIAELAKATGLPADALQETIDRWNQMVANGKDTDFLRADINGYNDLAAFGDGPYYAFPYIPYSMGSFGGLRTNHETQVLNTSGDPIPRLYAAGAVMSGMYTAPFYNACGWSILGTVHWGRKAAQQLHALTPWTTEAVAASVSGGQGAVEAAIAAASGSYKAGTYTASAQGLGGPVPVTVEFSDTAILSVSVGENSETVGIGTIAAEKLPESILLAQSADVDAIAGATITSNAILTAVNDCIAQATK